MAEIDHFKFSDDDDEHSYHFRGKPELLAGISEENLLEQLEIEYLGDITSCNKVTQLSILDTLLAFTSSETVLTLSDYHKDNRDLRLRTT